jgi:hypothetical protein
MKTGETETLHFTPTLSSYVYGCTKYSSHTGSAIPIAIHSKVKMTSEVMQHACRVGMANSLTSPLPQHCICWCADGGGRWRMSRGWSGSAKQQQPEAAGSRKQQQRSCTPAWARAAGITRDRFGDVAHLNAAVAQGQAMARARGRSRYCAFLASSTKERTFPNSRLLRGDGQLGGFGVADGRKERLGSGIPKV